MKKMFEVKEITEELLDSAYEWVCEKNNKSGWECKNNDEYCDEEGICNQCFADGIRAILRKKVV